METETRPLVILENSSAHSYFFEVSTFPFAVMVQAFIYTEKPYQFPDGSYSTSDAFRITRHCGTSEKDDTIKAILRIIDAAFPSMPIPDENNQISLFPDDIPEPEWTDTEEKMQGFGKHSREGNGF
jgi:hypothetical protein